VNSAQFPTYDAALAAKFATAARHSRLVRILRIAVPVTVILSMASIVAVSTFLNPFAMIPVKVDSGKLDAKLSIRFTQAAGKDPSVDVAGTLALRDLKVSAPDDGGSAQVASIDADFGDLTRMTPGWARYRTWAVQGACQLLRQFAIGRWSG